MALARVVYTQSVSGNKNFTVPFPYISRDHVKVTVNGANTPFTWNNPNTVHINPAPALGAVVEVRRVTERNNLLVDFKDGSTITESDLDLLALQNFYLAQEADDLAEESNGIANAAAGTAAGAVATADAASAAAASAVTTANSANATANSALSNANSAVNTANNALSTANTASSNANAAVTTANAAQTSANNAVSTANSANTTANSAASQATTAVSTANTAAGNAATALSTANTALANSEAAVSLANSASIKADSAEDAAEAASQAAQSAAADANTAVNTAQQLETVVNQVLDDVQAIAGGDLSDFAKNSENLSGLADAAAARQNLGLGNVNNTSDMDKPVSTAVQTALNGKANSSHTHPISDVTGLQTALDGKASASHTHSISNVTGLQTALDGKSNTGHGHAISDVTGLQTALDGKAASSHSHTWEQVTGKPTTYPPSTHTHTKSQITDAGTAINYNVGAADLPLFAGFRLDRRHDTPQDVGLNNCNSITFNSLYNCDGSVTSNSPTTGWFFLHTMVHGGGDVWVTQVAYGMTVDGAWFRRRVNGTWGAWYTFTQDRADQTGNYWLQHLWSGDSAGAINLVSNWGHGIYQVHFGTDAYASYRTILTTQQATTLLYNSTSGATFTTGSFSGTEFNSSSEVKAQSATTLAFCAQSIQAINSSSYRIKNIWKFARTG